MASHWEENPNFAEENMSSATLPTTNPTWNSLGSNPGLSGERPVNDRLTHRTTKLKFKMIIYTQSVPRSKHNPSLLYKPVS